MEKEQKIKKQKEKLFSLSRPKESQDDFKAEKEGGGRGREQRGCLSIVF